MTMSKLKFYKDAHAEWYIDLPEYKGPKEDLQMVGGADVLLDYLARGKEQIKLEISLEEKEGFSLLQRNDKIDKPDSGMFYDYKGYFIWICDVTTFVFGEFPKNIYFKKVL